MLLFSNIYAFKMIKALKYNIFNNSIKHIFSIFYKIYFNSAWYQHYQAINTNDTRFCNHRLQSSRSYFLNNCT